MEKATFDEYGKFVLSTTSTQSLDTRELTDRLLELREHTQAHKPVEFSQLLTASIGMQAESGEFSEIIKKIIFQGKEYTPDERFHLKRELGDVLWYCAALANDLGLSLDLIARMNLDKLNLRKEAGTIGGSGDNR